MVKVYWIGASFFFVPWSESHILSQPDLAATFESLLWECKAGYRQTEQPVTAWGIMRWRHLVDLTSPLSCVLSYRSGDKVWSPTVIEDGKTSPYMATLESDSQVGTCCLVCQDDPWIGRSGIIQSDVANALFPWSRWDIGSLSAHWQTCKYYEALLVL